MKETDKTIIASNYLRKIPIPFTTISNQIIDLIGDLSALGLYVYIFSKDEDYTLDDEELQRKFNVDLDFLRSKLAVLKDLGLIEDL